MSWTVQRQTRTGGSYYSAVYAVPGHPRRCVTVGFLVDAAPTADLTGRLRRFDPAGVLDVVTVTRLLRAVDERTAAAAVLFPLVSGPIVVLDPLDPVLRGAGLVAVAADLVAGTGVFPSGPGKDSHTLSSLAKELGALAPPGVAPPTYTPRPPPVAPVIPPDARGTMLLERYVGEVWTPVRRQGGSWVREEWWWDQRILPKLGSVRICDLDQPRWTAFLATLSVGGRSKSLCQTAYRCALTHAVKELHWIDQVHPFNPIPGATGKSLAEPEPLEVEEVERLLAATRTTMHRALLGTQYGQGLRPGEVPTLDWQDVGWRDNTLRVAGTKNRLAKAIVAMTPMTVAALRPWWEARDRPTGGPVFLAPDGTSAMTSYPRGVLRGAAARAGLNADRLRNVFPYLARHTFATLAAAAGIHSAHTRRQMRHSTESTVMERAYELASLKQVGRAFAGFGVAGPEAQTGLHGERKEAAPSLAADRARTEPEREG